MAERLAMFNSTEKIVFPRDWVDADITEAMVNGTAYSLETNGTVMRFQGSSKHILLGQSVTTKASLGFPDGSPRRCLLKVEFENRALGTFNSSALTPEQRRKVDLAHFKATNHDGEWVEFVMRNEPFRIYPTSPITAIIIRCYDYLVAIHLLEGIASQDNGIPAWPHPVRATLSPPGFALFRPLLRTRYYRSTTMAIYQIHAAPADPTVRFSLDYDKKVTINCRRSYVEELFGQGTFVAGFKGAIDVFVYAPDRNEDDWDFLIRPMEIVSFGTGVAVEAGRSNRALRYNEWFPYKRHNCVQTNGLQTLTDAAKRTIRLMF